ncbi:MAG: hypothetical protein HY719_02525 [Planctomycetes bacterium]|nr:hypothetical protein [Planctomycetota bacterium]
MGAGQPSDTRPEIEALLIARYREMSPSEKLECVRALTRAVQELALLDVRRRWQDDAPAFTPGFVTPSC